MRDAIKSFARIVQPPKEPKAPRGDWAMVERRLGFTLPADYKDFIAVYGTGSLQSFMHIWNYLDTPPNTDIVDLIRRITSEYQFDKAAGYAIQFKPFPESGCLIPFCSTDDGNYLNWSTTGKPDKWHVVAYDSGKGMLIPAVGVGMVACLTLLAEKTNPFGDAFCNVESFVPPVSYTPPVSPE